MTIRNCIAALLTALACIAPANAQTYPSRPITVIVPFAPGGPTDTVARIMANAMKDTLGQSMVVENVTGGGSTIGTGRAIAAAPDGYTLIVGNWSSAVGAGALYPVNWHIVRDLEPIAELSTSALMIVGRTGLPPTDIKGLVAWLKQNPGKATAVSVGAGSGAHICGLYFMEKTGTEFLFAQYRGGGPAMGDLVGNQIDLMCAEASQTLEHVRAGKMKAYVVMSPGRWAPLPDVPTMAEMGMDMQIPFWHGLWGPRGMPKDIVAKLNDAVVKAFADPAVQKRITDLGQTIPTRDQLTPEALGKYHQAEIDKWWPLIKSYGIKAN
jgi:tripartite-type tricarboxylate transporter receptor subunit TctC